MLTVMSVVRRRKGIPQIELANQVGCFQSEISLYELGQVKLKPEMAEKISMVLEVDPNDLQVDYDEYIRREMQC